MDLFSRELDDEAPATDQREQLDQSADLAELVEPTFTVSQLGAGIQEILREAFASIWVTGELQRLQVRSNGHRYFELVEKGEGDGVVGKLDAVIWKGDFARIAPVLTRSGQSLAEGVAVRCRVMVDFYPPFGRLQLHVKEIDPIFSLGELARRREETLRELAASGLLERNRGLPMAELPLTIALVTSHGSAAYHDFVATLAESGFGFRVVFLHSAVQGLDAERGVASALVAAAALGADCVVVVRGGGSKSDLAAFDSRAIAIAVASCAIPVLTGLGHEIDQSVADRVAFQAFKTPTKVAEFLVARIQGAELALVRLRERIARSAALPLSAARERLLDSERRALVARGVLDRAASRIESLAAAIARSARFAAQSAASRRRELASRLARAAPAALSRRERERTTLASRLVSASRARLATELARLEGRQRLVRELSPERTLARGFSITRRASGSLLKSADGLEPGARIVTTFATGSVASRVESE